MQFLGLRTVIHPALDLTASKAWFTQALGFDRFQIGDRRDTEWPRPVRTVVTGLAARPGR
jgi:hypothetical protein